VIVILVNDLKKENADTGSHIIINEDEEMEDAAGIKMAIIPA
jgi:hypothetical protein